MSDHGARLQAADGPPRAGLAPAGGVGDAEPTRSGWEVDDQFGAAWYRGSDLELAEEIRDGLVGGHLFAVSRQ